MNYRFVSSLSFANSYSRYLNFIPSLIHNGVLPHRHPRDSSCFGPNDCLFRRWYFTFLPSLLSYQSYTNETQYQPTAPPSPPNSKSTDYGPTTAPPQKPTPRSLYPTSQPPPALEVTPATDIHRTRHNTITISSWHPTIINCPYTTAPVTTVTKSTSTTYSPITATTSIGTGTNSDSGKLTRARRAIAM